MIQLNQASVSFAATKALKNVDLSLADGEQAALIGPSGSGKSTLLKTLATEYSLQSGYYRHSGVDTAKLSANALKNLRRSIGYIPQDLALVPNLKVVQNVILGQVGRLGLLKSLHDVILPSQKKLRYLHELLAEVGIPEKMFHRTDSLSGGQQQRTAIARALYQQANMILADEPVSAVDPSRAHSLLHCLTNTASQHNLTLLCSVHNLDYAKRFFPRLIGMRNGQIVYDGSPNSFTDKEFNSLYHISNG